MAGQVGGGGEAGACLAPTKARTGEPQEPWTPATLPQGTGWRSMEVAPGSLLRP